MASANTASMRIIAKHRYIAGIRGMHVFRSSSLFAPYFAADDFKFFDEGLEETKLYNPHHQLNANRG